MKIKIRKSSYLFILLLTIATKTLFSESDYFSGVKYITTFRALDIMYSILFTFLFFKVFFDNYYFYVLNRKNIIIRIGRKKYNLYIIKNIIINSSILFVFNSFIDFVLMGRLYLAYLICNILATTLVVILLPKRKEYENEMLIVITLIMLIKLVVYWFMIN